MPCRIIEGVGEARMEAGPDGGVPLLVQGILPNYWVDMPAGSKFVAKDAQTTRETTFRGPRRSRGSPRAASRARWARASRRAPRSGS